MIPSGVSAPAIAPPIGADQAVAADHHRDLAGFDRAQRLLDAVLEAPGALDPEDDPARVERLLDPRQQLQRPPAAPRTD